MSEFFQLQHLRREFQRGLVGFDLFLGPGGRRDCVGLLVGQRCQPGEPVALLLVRIEP